SPSFPAFTPTSGNLVRTCAERWGGKTFAVLGGERITYGEAEARSARLAKGLLMSGVGKGTRIGLLAPNSPDWIVGWLAATRVGAVLALLNTYNKARELGWVIRHADLQLLLTVDSHLGHDYLARLEQAAPGLAGQAHEHVLVESHPYLRAVWTWGTGTRPWAGPIDDLAARGDAVDDALLDAVEAEVTPADPMVVVYSSGSTADPKGAVHSHGAAIRHAHNLGQMRDIAGDDVLYTPMPLFWVGGFSFTLVAAMHVGATLVFEERFDPGDTLDLIERERVTQVLGWPHMAKALVDHPSFPERDLSALRGGTLSALLPQARQVGAAVPRANSLGMTETLGPHTFHPAGEPPPPGREGSFGPSVPGVEHKVVDPVTLEELPAGTTGELWLRGYSLMLGLHKREREETFTPDGWYRTGDSGFLDEDGHFWFTGRMGDLIKSSGMNITPRDVELALEAMPEVTMAFVTGIDQPERGQDVVAAIALRPGETLDEHEARTRLKDQIASYKVPRHIAVFADQSELPWLESGKVDRRRLAAILDERHREA
ncbi:MAG: class I adenylate-forming enzyme family protein, partial [Acidimicrobiia bacterium]